jgi:hypothetical protein
MEMRVVKDEVWSDKKLEVTAIRYGYLHCTPHLPWRRRILETIPRRTILGLLGAFAVGAAIMLFSWLFQSATVFGSFVLASESVPAAPSPDGKYVLQSEGIRAAFIPYGASISNLFIKDVNGVERDIVLGFDNASYYSIDRQHPHLGGVPGRYANRIKNRYVIPASSEA